MRKTDPVTKERMRQFTVVARALIKMIKPGLMNRGKGHPCCISAIGRENFCLTASQAHKCIARARDELASFQQKIVA